MSTGQLVRVACRVRLPEGGSQDDSCVRILSGSSVQVLPDAGASASETCKADFVYGPDAGQADIYGRLVEPLVDQFVRESKTVALVAFGASGSGKTHSLIGGKGRNAGALPRVVNAIFEGLAEKSQSAGEQTTIHHIEATHCELVGENIRDLFAADPDRTVRAASGHLNSSRLSYPDRNCPTIANYDARMS